MDLFIHCGDDFEASVELSPDRDLRVGRAPDNDIVLDDPTKGVSRYHAEIRYESGEWIVVDLESQNGVWVNDERVSRCAVHAGLSVTIGPYHLVFAPRDTASESSNSRYTQVNPPSPQPDTPQPIPVDSPAVPAAPPVERERRVSSGVLAGVLIVILLALIVLVSLRSQLRQRREQTPQPAPSEVPERDPPSFPATSVPPVERESDQYELQMTAARTARDAGLLEEAALKVRQALDLRPSNDDALRLKKEIDERLNAPGPATPPREKTVALPPGVPRPARRPRESATALAARAIAYHEAWGRANQALDRGDADAALEALTLVPDDQAYPEKNALVARAHEIKAAARVRAARHQLATAIAREAAGDLLRALRMYQDLQSDPEPTISAEARTRTGSLTATIDAAVKAAYREAHNLALGDTPELRARLLSAYRRVLQLTEPGDPRRSEAEEGLKR
jgi:tetratricopeptide (TPR) repeat protein